MYIQTITISEVQCREFEGECRGTQGMIKNEVRALMEIY